MNARQWTAIVWAGAVAVFSAYYHFLYAPSRAAALPALRGMTFWEALFSGELAPWLFLQHPAFGVAYVAIWVTIFAVGMYVTSGRAA